MANTYENRTVNGWQQLGDGNWVWVGDPDIHQPYDFATGAGARQHPEFDPLTGGNVNWDLMFRTDVRPAGWESTASRQAREAREKATRGRYAIGVQGAGQRAAARPEIARELAARGTYDPFAFQQAVAEMEKSLAGTTASAMGRAGEDETAARAEEGSFLAGQRQSWDQARAASESVRNAARARSDENAAASSNALWGSMAQSLAGLGAGLYGSGLLRPGRTLAGPAMVYNQSGMRIPSDAFDFLGLNAARGRAAPRWPAVGYP